MWRLFAIKAPPKQAAYEHVLVEKRSTQDALIALPLGGPSPLEVAQSRYHNGIEQTISYRGEPTVYGENKAVVRMVVPVSKFAQRGDVLKVGTISRNRIISELNTEFPGRRMAISNRLHSNAYGPYGYALSSASHGKNGVRCIYGWQNMLAKKNDRWSLLRGDSERAKLSIRMRVCRSGVSGHQLVDLMHNLRVNADPSVVTRPRQVSWSAGERSGIGPVLGTKTMGGYTSEPIAVDPVSDPAGKIVRKRTVRKKVVKRARAVTPPVQQPVEAKTSKVYAPPLPRDVLAIPQGSAVEARVSPADLMKTPLQPPKPRVATAFVVPNTTQSSQHGSVPIPD